MNKKYIIDFTIPQGPVGPYRISEVYLATLNKDYTDQGIEIKENERLPLERKEIDNDNICILDETNNTLQFNKEGYYEISILVNAYVPNEKDTGFNPNTDFISLGFRKVNDTVVFAGNSKWYFNETPDIISANGIFLVTNVSEPFELVNLSKRSIYLNSPDLKNTHSTSFFTNPLISIVIKHLGNN